MKNDVEYILMERKPGCLIGNPQLVHARSRYIRREPPEWFAADMLDVTAAASAKQYPRSS